MAGTNGIYDASKLGGGIAAWYGGNMKDRFEYTTANIPADVAKGVDRMDGTGYRANGAIQFTTDGKVIADPLSFFVGEEQVGDILSIFQIVKSNDKIEYVIPQFPFQKLEVAEKLRIGDGVLKWDATNKAFIIEQEDGSAAGIYTSGFMSSKGLNPGTGGGGGGGLIQSVYGYSDLGKTFLDTTLTDTFNAYTVSKLASRITSLENGSITSVEWGNITGTPTTIAGYKISDAVTTNTAQDITAAKTFGDVTLDGLNIKVNVDTTSEWSRALLFEGKGTRVGQIGAHAVGSTLNSIYIGTTYLSPWQTWNSTESTIKTFLNVEQVRRTGRSSSWWNGRNNAMIRHTTATGYSPLLSLKTPTGSWEQGVYTEEYIYLTYITDTNYNAGTNSISQQFKILQNGEFWSQSRGYFLNASNYAGYALPLTGGILTGALNITANQAAHIIVNNTNSAGASYVKVQAGGANKAEFGYVSSNAYGTYMYNYASAKYLGIKDDGTPHYQGSTLLHAGNYNSYSPTLTGNGATGTWNIGINGTAQYSRGLVINSTADFNATLVYNGIYSWNTSTANKPSNYGTMLQFSNVSNPNAGASGHWVNQLAWTTDDRIYVRQRINAGNWSSWKGLAYISDNVASATKLATARSIWGQSFDGTGNITGSMTVSGSITASARITTSADIYSTSWVRTTGQTGWYSETYGGGIYMVDNAWVRTYGSKHFYCNMDIQAGNIFYTSTQRSLLNTWANVFQNTAAFSARIGDEAVAINSAQLLLGWQNTISSVGYRTTYRIGSTRGSSGFGSMRFWIGNSDAQTSGNYLDLSGSGTANWTGNIRAEGLLYSVSNNITMTIGAQNTSGCHIYSNANIPFYFNNNIVPASNNAYTLGATSNRWLDVFANRWYYSTIGGLYIDTGSVYYTQKDGYPDIYCSSNEICFGSSTTTLHVNFRTSTKGAVNTWNWRAGSSTSWADFNLGNITVNGVLHATVGMYTEGYSSSKGMNTSSDTRLKNWVRNISIPIEAIAAAPSFEYTWKDGKGGLEAGSSAQYWEKVIKPCVPTGPDGYLSMRYGQIALLSCISASKKLLDVLKRTETIEQKVERLEKENIIKDQRIKELERRIEYVSK